MEPIFNDLGNDILTNIANFKKIVSAIIQIDNFKTCLEKISIKAEKYTKIHYNSLSNIDKLHRMIISHDSLLEYGLKLIQKYDVLKRIIIHRYPYILIDEYQDTSSYVIKTISSLAEYASLNKYNFFVGYFGDPKQNIYTNGIGEEIHTIHPNLEPINKMLNRRSHKEIIDTINIIRNDEIKQKSIFDDCSGGLVEFYEIPQNQLNDFKNKCKSDWNITRNNKLHCLVLTNEILAKNTGIESFYNCFKTTNYYKKKYDQLNSELLSTDTSKLGEIPNFIYNIIDLKYKVENNTLPISKIIKHKHCVLAPKIAGVFFLNC